MKKKSMIGGLVLALFSMAWAAAETKPGIIVIRGARIVPVVGEEIPEGMILVRNGRIEALGRDLAIPEGADDRRGRRAHRLSRHDRFLQQPRPERDLQRGGHGRLLGDRPDQSAAPRRGRPSHGLRTRPDRPGERGHGRPRRARRSLHRRPERHHPVERAHPGAI